MKNKFLIFALALGVILASCGDAKKDEVVPDKDKNETRVGGTALRKGELFTEDIDLGEMSTEVGEAPGSGKKMDRAFENAPPMIPHKTDGFLPITAKSNMCVACHTPPGVSGATPMPKSHMTSFRPDVVKKGGKYKVNETKSGVTVKDLDGKLSTAMYNCNQCHVSMTNATLDVKNLFKPEFRDEKHKSSSNMKENINEGVK